MEIEALNCRCCGGILKVRSNLCVCEYCGATNFISDVANKYINQLNRANKLRQEREFDNAARIYDNILAENVPTADILWYRTLCEYGIEYVPDPMTEKYIPTMHRVNEESILAYHYYVEALSVAEKEQKETLQNEAEYINKIQNEYLNIAKNESPYDVFICYKETDESTGEKTEDVQVADELYRDLTSRGFKVFFARVTLKSKLSIDYEPYIFAALKSARAMVVIGTRSEYFMSVWVKNEWGRFLKLMQDNPSKQMFFACDDPEELPRAFAQKQAALLGEEGALLNLADNVESFLRNKVTKKAEAKPDRDEAYQKVLKLVRAREHFRAISAIDNFMKLYPNDAEGAWLKLINKHKCTPTTITKLKANLFADPEYSEALKLADENQKAGFVEIAKICNANLEQQRAFDQLLENESIKYVNRFDENSPEGEKTFAAKKQVVELAKKVEKNNDILRYTFACGTAFYFLGNLLSLIILRNGGARMAPASVFVGLPFIAFGVLLLLSYNLPIDIIVTSIVIVLTILSSFNNHVSQVFRIIAIILPIVAYMATNNSFYLNRIRNRILHGTVSLKKALDELKLETDKASTKLSHFASDLLKEFKKNNDVQNNVIEIHDDDYYNAQKKILNLYKDTEQVYDPLINMTIPTDVGKRITRTESAYGLIALIFSFVPIIDIVGLGFALYDILTDKHRTQTHVSAVSSLIVDMLMLVVFYIIFLAV